MTRLLLTPLAALMTLFAACIGIIHAQQYDNTALRDFLISPEGCAMPCFMGIRPGMTRAEDAIAILEVHEWVSGVQGFYDMASDLFLVQWGWSGLQPEFLDTSKTAYLSVENDIVIAMMTGTRIQQGDIWLALGTPNQGSTTIRSGRAATVVILSAGFLDNAMVAESMSHCPTTLPGLFQSPVTLLFTSDMEYRYSDAHSDPSDWVRPCG